MTKNVDMKLISTPGPRYTKRAPILIRALTFSTRKPQLCIEHTTVLLTLDGVSKHIIRGRSGMAQRTS